VLLNRHLLMRAEHLLSMAQAIMPGVAPPLPLRLSTTSPLPVLRLPQPAGPPFGSPGAAVEAGAGGNAGKEFTQHVLEQGTGLATKEKALHGGEGPGHKHKRSRSDKQMSGGILELPYHRRQGLSAAPRRAFGLSRSGIPVAVGRWNYCNSQCNCIDPRGYGRSRLRSQRSETPVNKT
jgi:hypothetical protein